MNSGATIMNPGIETNSNSGRSNMNSVSSNANPGGIRETTGDRPYVNPVATKPNMNPDGSSNVNPAGGPNVLAGGPNFARGGVTKIVPAEPFNPSVTTYQAILQAVITISGRVVTAIADTENKTNVRWNSSPLRGRSASYHRWAKNGAFMKRTRPWIESHPSSSISF
jgi:hypothetical protein